MQNNQKIPEGWSVKKGKDIASLITKGASPKWQGFEYCDSGTLFVTSENVRDGFLDISNPKFLPSAFSEKQKRSILKNGDILINIVGASIGRSCLYNRDIPANINQAVCLFRCNSLVHNLYTLLYLSLPKTIRTLLETQTESARPNLSLTDISLLNFLLPPLAEQEKIAEILGTWDEAIEKLSSLIEQKKLLKKGLMQKLLTGKVRLPGFTQPWKEVKLGELIKQKRIVIEKGKSLTSENIVEGAIPVIAGGKTSPYSHNKFTHNKPCITISASGAYAGYVWKHITPIWASDCNVLYGTDYDTNFLGCCLEYKQQQIYQLQTGGAQPHVYATDIKIITVPNINITEQQAIADVLSTADGEIDLLNKKLEALKEQKKCLMQQLLTGQTRVKVN